MSVQINTTKNDDIFEVVINRGHHMRVLELSYEELESLMVELSAHVKPRDRYHTMDDLYEYRMLYNAHAANQWARHGTYPVVKSWKHSDGELCFGGGWFIVVATLPEGQVSNHYPAENWSLFNVPEVLQPPEFDAHTPHVAAGRLRIELDRHANDPWFI